MQIKMRNCPPKCRLMYTAPFYQNSSSIFEDNLIKVISQATKQIIVCAQHISAYKYSFEGGFISPNEPFGYISKEGFLYEVLKKAKTGVQTIFISQTYVDEAGDHGCRTPENKTSFIKFTSAAKNVGCKYYVNSDIHSKFIVVDNHVILTTCNFTPTQFIYLKNVNIEKD